MPDSEEDELAASRKTTTEVLQNLDDAIAALRESSGAMVDFLKANFVPDQDLVPEQRKDQP